LAQPLISLLSGSSDPVIEMFRNRSCSARTVAASKQLG